MFNTNVPLNVKLFLNENYNVSVSFTKMIQKNILTKYENK